MKGIKVATLIAVLAVVFGMILIQNWWHQETAKGHYLRIANIRVWGFRKLHYQTEAECPPGQNCNTLAEIRQYGPIEDNYVYPPCFDNHPACVFEGQAPIRADSRHQRMSPHFNGHPVYMGASSQKLAR